MRRHWAGRSYSLATRVGDQIAERQTLSLLADLKAGDGYDRELVLAYERMHKSEAVMERLEKILNKFEAKA